MTITSSERDATTCAAVRTKPSSLTITPLPAPPPPVETNETVAATLGPERATSFLLSFRRSASPSTSGATSIFWAKTGAEVPTARKVAIEAMSRDLR